MSHQKTIKEMPTEPPSTPWSFEEMLTLTAQALHDGDWLQEGAKFAEVPGIVARLVEHHAALRRNLDDVISAMGERFVEGLPIAPQLRALLACQALDAITTPDAIGHLQDQLAGTGAALLIDDDAQDVILQYLGVDITTPRERVVEALDAIATLQNLIEGGE